MSRDFDTALNSLERDTAILDLIEKLNTLDDRRLTQIEVLHAEIAELRDAVLALSHRIEAVTRTRSIDLGLHSVKS